MGALSISKAWNEAGAFLAREARLVLPIALLLIAIPSFALQIFIPPLGVEPSDAQSTASLLLTPIGLLAGLVAGLAISHLALRPGASVGEALQSGLRRFASLLLASLLIAVPLVVIVFLILLALVPILMPYGLPVTPYNLPESLVPVIAVLTILILAIWIKLMLMTPVAAAERVGPLEIIRRSWTLTRSHYWRLFGAILLMLLAFGLVFGAVSWGVGSVLLLAMGPPVFGTSSFALLAVLEVLLQTVFTIVLIVFLARVYAQLSGRDAEAAEVFR